MTERIRIVYFTGFLGFGGSERQLFLLLQGMDKQRFEPHVVVFNESPNETYEAPLKAAGVRVWPIPATIKSIPKRMWFLFKLLRKLKPQIVHSWTFHDNAYAGIVGRMAGVKHVWGSLRNSIHAREVQKLPAIYRAISLHGVKAIVVNSQRLVDELHADGLRPDKVLLLRNCVEMLGDSAESHSPLSDLNIPQDAQTVAIVGNLRHQKNHHMFVTGMARLIPHFSNAYGVIVGQPLPLNPGVAEGVQQVIDEHNINDRIIMTGFRNDVPRLMQHFTMLALTSHYEGMPNVILEAMAAGLPVVATRVGSVPELIEDGVTGLIVECDDTDAFVAAVEQLLSDPAKAIAMGLAGQAKARANFSTQSQVGQLQQYYFAALQQNTPLTPAPNQAA